MKALTTILFAILCGMAMSQNLIRETTDSSESQNNEGPADTILVVDQGLRVISDQVTEKLYMLGCETIERVETINEDGEILQCWESWGDLDYIDLSPYRNGQYTIRIFHDQGIFESVITLNR